jgi:hypothetical protein
MRHLSRRRLLSLASLSPVALVARATTAAAQDPVNPPPDTCPRAAHHGDGGRRRWAGTARESIPS